jgi:hypothetical protein
MNLSGYSFAWYCGGCEFESRSWNEQSRQNFSICSFISSKYRESTLQ